MVKFRNYVNRLISVILFSACNYTYLQNFIKLWIQYLIKVLYCSVRCCSKGYHITFGKHNFKHYSATSNKCLNQLQYAYSQIKNCEPNSIFLLLLVVDENWYDHFTGWNVTNVLQSVRNKIPLDELTVVLLVKISKLKVKTKFLSVPAEKASIPPSDCHLVHIYIYIIHVTHLICRVNISKICIDLVIITITILITKPTSTNWWSCPNHSVVLPSTISHHLPATNTVGCSLHTLLRDVYLYDVVTWHSTTECTAPVIRQHLVYSRCVSVTQLPVTVCCVLLCM
jgi:hypothetical protein